MSKTYNAALQARVEQYLKETGISQAKAAPKIGIVSIRVPFSECPHGQGGKQAEKQDQRVEHSAQYEANPKDL